VESNRFPMHFERSNHIGDCAFQDRDVLQTISEIELAISLIAPLLAVRCSIRFDEGHAGLRQPIQFVKSESLTTRSSVNLGG